MFPEPTTLAKIYFQQSHLCHWRVRNVQTLEDYCILWPKSCKEGQPQWFQALNLDQNSLKVELSGNYKMYVLLSTEKEATTLSQMKESDMKRVLKESYDNVKRPGVSAYRRRPATEVPPRDAPCTGFWGVELDDPAAP